MPGEIALGGRAQPSSAAQLQVADLARRDRHGIEAVVLPPYVALDQRPDVGEIVPEAELGAPGRVDLEFVLFLLGRGRRPRRDRRRLAQPLLRLRLPARRGRAQRRPAAQRASQHVIHDERTAGSGSRQPDGSLRGRRGRGGLVTSSEPREVLLGERHERSCGGREARGPALDEREGLAQRRNERAVRQPVLATEDVKQDASPAPRSRSTAATSPAETRGSHRLPVLCQRTHSQPAKGRSGSSRAPIGSHPCFPPHPAAGQSPRRRPRTHRFAACGRDDRVRRGGHQRGGVRRRCRLHRALQHRRGRRRRGWVRAQGRQQQQLVHDLRRARPSRAMATWPSTSTSGAASA